MFSWLKYWVEQKRMLRMQINSLQYSRWERRNCPAFNRPRNRWSTVKTL